LGTGNAAAAPAGVTLRGGVDIDELSDLRDGLDDKRTTLTAKLNEREFVRGDIRTLAAELTQRLDQFNGRVRVLFPEGSRFVNALPKVPNPESAAEKVITPLTDAENIWENIEAAGTTISLVDNYLLAAFKADIVKLKDSYKAYARAVTEEKLARGARNELQDKIYPILKQYREAIPTYFPAESALVTELPRLTPLPGSTPKAVNASAVWDADAGKARITWDASDNANLKKYEVRYTPGESWEDDDASVVASILPDAPLELLTLEGLTQPGAAATFKVYVVTTTGNEAGSTAMTVQRPS
jgi:hypothetical protein